MAAVARKSMLSCASTMFQAQILHVLNPVSSRLQSLIDTRHTQGSLKVLKEETTAESREQMSVSPAALAWRIIRLQDAQRTKQSICQHDPESPGLYLLHSFLK